MGAPPIYPHIDPGRVSGLEPSMIAVQQAAIDTAQAVGTLATTVGNIPAPQIAFVSSGAWMTVADRERLSGVLLRDDDGRRPQSSSIADHRPAGGERLDPDRADQEDHLRRRRLVRAVRDDP